MRAVCLIALLFSGLEAFGGSSGQGLTIRCSGTTLRGDRIGIDVTVDAADRITSAKTFERDQERPVNLARLASHFVKLDSAGRLALFGLKSVYGDIEVSFARDSDDLSALQIGSGQPNLAVSGISCQSLN